MNVRHASLGAASRPRRRRPRTAPPTRGPGLSRRRPFPCAGRSEGLVELAAARRQLGWEQGPHAACHCQRHGCKMTTEVSGHLASPAHSFLCKGHVHACIPCLCSQRTWLHCRLGTRTAAYAMPGAGASYCAAAAGGRARVGRRGPAGRGRHSSGSSSRACLRLARRRWPSGRSAA